MNTPKIGRSKQAKANNAITLRDGHPAINVKVYHLRTPEGISESQAESAYDWTVEGFWQDATIEAHERGYAGVFTEGRSGGWLVPYLWSKPGVQHSHNGRYSQGPDAGYPRYPDAEHDSAAREKFRGFQRAIRRMLADVQKAYDANCEEARTQFPENRTRCNQCEALMINGVFCHETGCPNTKARYDSESGEWIKQYKCFTCGCMADEGSNCCSDETEEN